MEAIETLWQENPEVREMLSASSTVDEARDKLFQFAKEMEWEYRNGKRNIAKLDYAQALEALKVFNNLISLRNERLSGFSTVESLMNLAKGKAEDIGIGFVEEFVHLFRAIKGKFGMSRGWLGPILEAEGIKMIDFSKIKGKAAGIARSDYLDKVYGKIEGYIKRYPSGLDPDIIQERKKNKEKILKYFGGKEEDWEDPAWQLKHIIKDREGLEHLKNLVPLTDEDVRAIEIAVDNYIPFGITPYYLSLFDFNRADRKNDYLVRAQVIPPIYYVEKMLEHRDNREYYFDFMGEHDTSPEELITRRYTMIAILKAYDTCPQICVYCQRNWEITGPMMKEAMPSKEVLDKALDWFESHPSMREVLITGGDPLALGDGLIKYIMDRLSNMDHIISIRWGSRTPVTIPMRITKELAKLLGSYVEPGKRNVCVVTHVEGATEITPELTDAITRLRDEGIYVYNQLVYTLETSRRFQNVATRIALKVAGIDPYYTFYPKGKQETKDYLVPVARLWQERKEEARLLPGQFRTDEPVFNVPRLGKNHIRAWQDRELIGIDKDGSRIYLWHPWEKGIAQVEPYIYKDIPIHNYLEELKVRGEDIDEYKTIWYYY